MGRKPLKPLDFGPKGRKRPYGLTGKFTRVTQRKHNRHEGSLIGCTHSLNGVNHSIALSPNQLIVCSYISSIQMSFFNQLDEPHHKLVSSIKPNRE